MKKFAPLAIGLLLLTTSASAQENTPAPNTATRSAPATQGTKIVLRHEGKSIASITCKGRARIVQPCVLDTATNTLYIEIPDAQLFCNGKNAKFEGDATVYPEVVTISMRSGGQTIMEVLMAEGATVLLLPITQ